MLIIFFKKLLIISPLVLVVLVIASATVSAYLVSDKYCFSVNDCGNVNCPNNIVCVDDIRGCQADCLPSGFFCAMDTACSAYSGVETQKCGHLAIPASCNITANPPSANPGESITLTWTSNTQTCTASGNWSGTKSWEGSETVVVSTPGIYALTCTNICPNPEPFAISLTTCSVTVVSLRHENCCDNWGWNNVSRCGGCCGPAANCVGYDTSSPYYWHNSNDFWQCSYSDSSNSIYHLTQVGGCGTNQPPNMPTLIAPPNNTWINYNPTFQATVSDPDGNQVRAHFDITDYGTGISGYVNSGQTASWGPIAIPDYGTGPNGEWYWRAKAQDTDGLFSPYTAYWIMRKDTVPPTAVLDQENGESADNLIWVNLTETDDRSGIAEGDVDVRINGGAWTNTGLPNGGSTINNFIYTATATSSTQQDIYTTVGTFTWTAPAGVTTITAEAWGGGAGGGGVNDSMVQASGGGGGGAYAKKNSITVIPGNTYTVVVGAGGTDSVAGTDSYFINTNTVLAKGGKKGIVGFEGGSGGAGGSSSSSKGDIKYSGGSGGNGYYNEPSGAGGGGGGSSAGTGANGDNGANGSCCDDYSGGAGGTAPIGGGAGANGASSNMGGADAAQVGAGGGGGGAYWSNYTSGGHGYQGKVILTYTITTSVVGSTYEFRYRAKDNAGNWSDWAYDGLVTIISNDPPQATNLSVTSSDFCENPPSYAFQWTYSDINNDTESQFDFQIDNNSDFSSLEINRSFNNLSYPSPTIQVQSTTLATSPLSGYLNYNTRYYWRTKVYDMHGTDSGWVAGSSFITFLHHYPSCDFDWVPGYPLPNELTQFTDTSRCYDEDPVNGSDCSSSKGDSFLYDFDYTDKGGVFPLTSTLENPTASYSEPGTWTVKLQVTDSHGFTCSQNQTIRISFPLPRWREVRPH